MIAPTNATSETMKKALAYTIAALAAASELDMDRSDDDRAVFAKERNAISPLLQDVIKKERASEDDELENSMRLQARVTLGDAVLDRGFIDGKERMKLELKRTDPDAADQVFGKRTADTTRAPIQIEPGLVLNALARLEHAPDFPTKKEVRLSLEQRVGQQNLCLQERSAGETASVRLSSALSTSIRLASDELYGLEKRLLDRFKRDADYVRKFFLDVSSPRKSKDDTRPIPTIPENADA
jgi:hypothetical protein